MSQRIFLVAAPYARLAARSQGGVRVAEGHFPATPERSVSVVMADQSATLVVLRSSDGTLDRADIPRAHAEALMMVAAGKVDFLQTGLRLDSYPIQLTRLVSPGLLDLATVEFDSPEAAAAFEPPAWFGPEVTGQPNYRLAMIALKGLPEGQEVNVSNEGLDALLDALENRVSRKAARSLTSPAAQPAPPPAPVADEPDDPEISKIEDNVIRELARSLQPQRR